MQPSLRFEFATATRIIFGAGTLKEVGSLAATLGRKALIVTGRNTTRAAPLLKLLAIPHEIFSVPGEPTVHEVIKGAEHARSEQCDLVIGYGGGSALDAAKAIAAL